MVLRQGLTLTMIGAAIGLALAAAASRLLGSLLFGVGATDPLTFIGSALLFFASVWRRVTCRHAARPQSTRWRRCGTSRQVRVGRCGQVGRVYGHAPPSVALFVVAARVAATAGAYPRAASVDRRSARWLGAADRRRERDAQFYTEAEYYAARVDELRTYPLHQRPGTERLSRRDAGAGPQPLIEIGQSRTDAEWVAAGREMFDGMDLPENRTDDPEYSPGSTTLRGLARARARHKRGRSSFRCAGSSTAIAS